VAGLTVCIIAYGPALIRFWMGPGFEDATAPLFVLTTLGIFIVAQGPTGNLLLGADRHRLVGIVAIVDVLSNLSLSLYLVRHVGLSGVALGTAIPYIILNMGVLVPAACRLVQVPLLSLVRTAAVPALVAAAVAAGTAAMLRGMLNPDSLMVVLGQSAIVAFVYVGAFWFVGLGANDRARYRNALVKASSGAIQPRVASELGR
jgi:O-antigen/teichoic acid export membrane protein